MNGGLRPIAIPLFFIACIFLSSPTMTSTAESPKTNSSKTGIKTKASLKKTARVKKYLKTILNANSLPEITQAWHLADFSDKENQTLRQELKKTQYVRRIDFLGTKLLKKLEKKSKNRSGDTIQKKIEGMEKKYYAEIEQQNKNTIKRLNQLMQEPQAEGRNTSDKDPMIGITSVDPMLISPGHLIIIRGNHFLMESGIVRLLMYSEDRDITLESERWSDRFILARFPFDNRPFLQGPASIFVQNDNEETSELVEIGITPAKEAQIISHQVTLSVDPGSGVSSYQIWKDLILKNYWQVIEVSIANVEYFTGASKNKDTPPSIWFTQKPRPGLSVAKTTVTITAPPQVLPIEQTLVSFFVHLIVQGPDGFEFH